ncbi:MAG: hypothetical protein QM840_08130, partial [Verrucomicrobiota bacterium]|nr:hypothetical protein [Verrucomicrobiota bacterium]
AGAQKANSYQFSSIAAPAAGQYRITVTHSGGLPGNPTPSVQKLSVAISGVTPPSPVIPALNKSPSPA